MKNRSPVQIEGKPECHSVQRSESAGYVCYRSLRHARDSPVQTIYQQAPQAREVRLLLAGAFPPGTRTEPR